MIVSNRLPFSVTRRGGEYILKQSVGGLATGIGSVYKSLRSLWIGWPGISGQVKEIDEKLTEENCYPVSLSQHDVENYYHGFCNKTIWPLFHYFVQHTVYSESMWKSYKHVNELFCDVIMDIAKPDDIIWIHDYQLMLLPGFIRNRNPDTTIGFFLHIPFPSFEVFRLIPWREEIIKGILGADIIGFHTYEYVRHFLDSVRRMLGYEHALGQIETGSRVVKVDAFPMGIDFSRFELAIDQPEVQREVGKIKKRIGDCKVIISIDRLDYTKGIPQRLEAFDLFLERNPEFKEKVVMILVAGPSRTRVEHYIQLKRQVDELVGMINGKHGTIGWVPIWYLFATLPFQGISALYHVADVALVIPSRDGMNLIAKEFVASKKDGRGVLILSEVAGAAKELGEALIVNPNDIEEIASTIKFALCMSEEEQISRNKAMQERLRRYNVSRWVNDFLDGLSQIKEVQNNLATKKLSGEVRKELIIDYRKARNRLIFLDYDGTLIPFSSRPQDAKPDEELLNLLRRLSDESNVVIISGRDKRTLDRWFGKLKVGMVAEHGVWVKEKRWKTIEPIRNDWKDKIRPILELHTDRTPGSFIEEKEYSLVWHYRKADPELGAVRARELKDALLHLVANLNIGVLEGNKVVEIKNIGINKGKAVLWWFERIKADFILAVGDDITDEDIFEVLPAWAYSIRVGIVSSKARFNLSTPSDVRALIKEVLG